jgi:3-oxoacyl-[acyl-carrier-protein] synthase II
LRALSTRNDDPVHASRPFELHRDGFVIGEGAGILILEELEFARKRGARIYCEVVGYGMTGDAFHITMPDQSGSGAVRVMKKALADAGRRARRGRIHQRARDLNPLQRQVRDHGHQEDLRRTREGDGHQFDKVDDGSSAGRSGGVEGVFSVLSIHRNLLLPTINYEHPTPIVIWITFLTRHVKLQSNTRSLIALAFGGTNAALLFKRYEE